MGKAEQLMGEAEQLGEDRLTSLGELSLSGSSTTEPSPKKDFAPRPPPRRNRERRTRQASSLEGFF